MGGIDEDTKNMAMATALGYLGSAGEQTLLQKGSIDGAVKDWKGNAIPALGGLLASKTITLPSQIEQAQPFMPAIAGFVSSWGIRKLNLGK
mmetsp:Transcript_50363/g.161278  ORF Transcript_50363/g.161278 Transcript_50363/m.161278 type:complete len:91 (-) Transcript_50363:187-459(-)